MTAACGSFEGVNSGHCARPACYGTAAAWLAYDYDARCAWLDDEASEAGPGDRSLPSHVWPLCERHADTLRVPRGWFCVDRRAARLGPTDGGAPGATAPGDAGAEAGVAGAGANSGGAGQGPHHTPGPNGGRVSSIL